MGGLKHLLISYGLNETFTVADQQSWSKGCRQTHEIKQNKFFYGMFYS